MESRVRVLVVFLAVYVGFMSHWVWAQEEPSVATNSSSGQQMAGGTPLNFETDLFTGRFVNRYGLKVPPGRRDFAPDVGLSYNSSGGNGWLGVGWSLDMGYIQRNTDEGVPVSWSNPSGPPDNYYDDTLGFMFSFQGVTSKLVPTGSPNEYGAEVESIFLRFTYLGTHWEVVDRSGNRYYFGNTTSSRMESLRPGWPANTGSSTFRWSLARSEDVHGNYVEYSYTTDDFGDVPGKVATAQYLDRIDYNGHVSGIAPTHRIQFVLEDRPQDAPFSFRSGHRVEHRKRLKEVVLTVSGQLARRYELSYDTSPSTQRSRLVQIQEFGHQGGALPATVFGYNEQEFGSGAVGGFGPSTSWPGNLDSQGQLGGSNPQYWAAVNAYGLEDHVTHLGMLDVDGDGLLDRIMPKLPISGGAPQYVVQFNSCDGFHPTTHDLGSFDNGEYGNYGGRSVRFTGTASSNSHHNIMLLDFNRDGAIDRVSKDGSGSSQIHVQCSDSGYTFPTAPTAIAIDTQGSTNNVWTSTEGMANGRSVTSLIDVTGDGRPDRVMRERTGNEYGASGYDHYVVQYNNGNGFDPARGWAILSQDSSHDGWSSVFFSSSEDTLVTQMDMNGDGLPDRVMRERTGTECGASSFDHFVIEFNNGTGYEGSWDCWALSSQGNTSSDWNSPFGEYKQNIGSSNDPVYVWPAVSMLRDINADGLPDRVMRKSNSANYDRFVVQINYGSGFGPEQDFWFDPVTSSQGSTTDHGNSPRSRGGFVAIQTLTDLFDINGDGLVDRVMRKAGPPYNSLVVELSTGPVPDLLNSIDNGMGGIVGVDYRPSTEYDNRDVEWSGDPWSNGARSLLPVVIQTVCAVSSDDGIHPISTTEYVFKNGFYDPTTREFRGFNCSTKIDPIGTETRTYFHQGGGIDKSSEGEFQDDGSVAKKGMPYLTELWGADGKLYSRVLNKVDELVVSPGRCFPYVAQTIVQEFEGLGLTNYRAKAKHFSYDAQNGNLLVESNFGEVINVDQATHTFTDIANDTLTTIYHFANLSNPDIVNKPAQTFVLDDSGSKIQETQFDYTGQETTGSLTRRDYWLDYPTPTLLSEHYEYDNYGNTVEHTSPGGVVTVTSYDSVYHQFPESVTVDPFGIDFVTQQVFDARSGLATLGTDQKGLQEEFVFDEFFRLLERNLHQPDGTSIWEERNEYYTGGVISGISYNYTRTCVNDGVDTVNGLETYSYTDGMGRTIQTRTEAETAEVRVTGKAYDERGNVSFESRAYFGSGFAFEPIGAAVTGTSTDYDVLGRPIAIVPPMGDVGSPTSAQILSYGDPIALDPWVKGVTDAEGARMTTRSNAYGHVIEVVEHASASYGSDFVTDYEMDLLGRMTGVTDHEGNTTKLFYDSLGRRYRTEDPDMGEWNYIYDADDRVCEQTDGKGQRLAYQYDAIGRVKQKHIFDTSGNLATTTTYTHDSTSHAGYTVYKGQLHEVVDDEGWTRHSYDIRGNLIKTTRYLNKTGQQYTTRAVFDNADNMKRLIYPRGNAKVKYTYDTGGNLDEIRSISGTGTTEVFFQSLGYGPLGEILGVRYGNGLDTLYQYYPNSRRLERISVVRVTGVSIYVDDDALAGGDGSLQSPFNTIQAGIDAASVGDTVIVYDGTYSGTGNTNLNFGGKDIAVRSLNGPSTTIIDGGGFDRGFEFDGAETAAAILDGFTVTNCFTFGDGGAFVIRYSSSPTIRNCVFEDNRCFGGGAGAAILGGTPRLENCIIRENKDSFVGAGLFITAEPTIVNCLIADNGSDQIFSATDTGGGVHCQHGDPTFINCTITGNRASDWGSAFYVLGGASQCVLKNCIVWDNPQTWGAPISSIELRVAGHISIEYSNVEGGESSIVATSGTYTWGQGNIDADPQFVSSASGDYRLSNISPCIDAGNNAAVLSDTVIDLNGVERFFDDPGTPDTGAGSPPLVDLGPYEYGATESLPSPLDGDVFQDLTYRYNSIGNLTEIRDWFQSGTAAATLTDINYDELHRLTGYSRNGSIYDFDYSPIGNVLINPESGPGVYQYASTQPHGQPHAVTSANGMTYAYDVCGNMTQRGNQTLAYDERNRLTRVSGPGLQVDFGYNDEGSRLWRESSSGLSIWIGAHYEERGGKKLCHVIADGRRIASFEPPTGVVQPVPVQVQVPGASSSGTTTVRAVAKRGAIPLDAWIRYYHKDHLQSTKMLSDRDGNIQQRHQYSAFGAETYISNPGKFPTGNQYTDQVIDEETGLYYYKARYYDPVLARFIQPDNVFPQADNPQSLNRYSYVLNNPLLYNDPSGNIPVAWLAQWGVQTAISSYLSYLQQSQQQNWQIQLAQPQYTQLTAGSLHLTREGLLLLAPLDLQSGSSLRQLDLFSGFTQEDPFFLTRQTIRNTRYHGLGLQWQHGLPQGSLLGWERASYQLVRSSALGQVPVQQNWGNAFLYNRASTIQSTIELPALGRWAQVPAGLGGMSGGLGIVSSVQSDNDFVVVTGTTAGVLEVQGAITYGGGALVGDAAAMGVGRGLMRFAGWAGLAVTAIDLMHTYGDQEAASEFWWGVLHDPMGDGRHSDFMSPWVPDPVTGRARCHGNYCIGAGTLIETYDGLKPIEDLAVGDFVASCGLTGSRAGYREVREVSQGQLQEIYRVVTSEGSISLSAEHVVFVTHRGWILAQELTPGDSLGAYASGSQQCLDVLEVIEEAKPVQVYNLRVDGPNNYFVSESGILVEGLGH